MPRAAARLDRWLGAAGDDPSGAVLDAVRAAFDDDLDTATAVAAIDDAVDGGVGITEAAALLGVLRFLSDEPPMTNQIALVLSDVVA
jgi:L-cysteine:1D-myo-inositol 2-amino-2-deoxy-alpha-D-glucopyranoside ligase